MKSPDSIAGAYLQYHEGRGFTSLPVRSLVSPRFPTGFLMSAGFDEIDNVLRGDRTVPSRGAVVQPCFRYFDALENPSAAHLSLFLMGAALYHSEWTAREALQIALDFLLKEALIPRERLWLSTFGGGSVAGTTVAPHEAPTEWWMGAGLPAAHIVRLGVQSNFWHEGGVSPQGRRRFSGPQAELFFERTLNPCSRRLSCVPGCPCNRFVELANVIFIRHALSNDGHLENVPELCESVMGIERLLLASEGSASLAETAWFRSRIEPALTGTDADELNPSTFVAYERLRSFCCLVTLGCRPAGKGRGSILRRLFRVVLRHAAIASPNPEVLLHNFLDAILLREAMVYGIDVRAAAPQVRRAVDDESRLLRRSALGAPGA